MGALRLVVRWLVVRWLLRGWGVPCLVGHLGYIVLLPYLLDGHLRRLSCLPLLLRQLGRRSRVA